MKTIKGNIFTTSCQTIVNTVNCVGVMGAGIAYEFRLRYPGLFEKYVELCNKQLIQVGSLWLYPTENKWILNFPTKFHWKYPTKIEYLEKGLQKFMDTYKEKKIESIAFPLLGASNGGLSTEVSFEIMKKYLSKCDIPVEIYFFDKNAKDDLFTTFRNMFLSYDDRKLANETGLRIDFVKKVKLALENPEVNRIMDLRKAKGIGEKTLEKAFNSIMNDDALGNRQLTIDYKIDPK